MSIIDWIPAISTTALFGFAVYLCRKLIATRLTYAVKHEFDEKLEVVRADQRRSEQELGAKLDEEATRVAALRDGALTGLVTRQAARDKRRLDAVDALWSAFNSLSSGKMPVAWMSVIKFEAAAIEAAKNPLFRSMFDAIDISQMKYGDGAENQRPFVSDLAWAYFEAYRATMGIAIVQITILKSGVYMPQIIKEEAVLNLVKAALPHRSEHINKYGIHSCFSLLDELESCLLAELRAFLEGRDLGKASVQQAAEIMKAVKEVSLAEIPDEVRAPGHG